MALDSKYVSTPIVFSDYESSPSSQLQNVMENFKNMITTVKTQSGSVKKGIFHIALTAEEHSLLISNLLDASRSLNQMSENMRPISNCLLTPSLLKSDHQSVSSPEDIVMSDEEPLSADYKTIDVGQEFSCLEEVENAFKDYALRSGFNVCKGNSKKDVYQEYACSARGKVRNRKNGEDLKQRNRQSIKKMCKCHIIARKKDDLWVVTTRKLEHTHPLMDSEKIKKTAKNRFIPDDVKQKAIEMYAQNEAPAKIQYFFEQELGERCTWSMKDLYNMLYRHKI